MPFCHILSKTKLDQIEIKLIFENMENTHKILIVDDELVELETLCDVVSSSGEIIASSSGIEALDIIQSEKPALVITDLVLKDEIDGLKILDFAREKIPDSSVILVTGHASVETALKAMKSGAYDYLVKPVDIRRLRAVVDKALELYRIARERTRLLEAVDGETQFQGMVGVSSSMYRVFKKIGAVAPTDSTVLILGESGTGKELVAEAIHNLSNRKGKLVKINCSAIPENLLESELFGYEKGAFTGASRKKQGKFELANNGTLFLDEIGDMPLQLQAKLLRTIESGEVEPLGAEQPIKIDVRIVTATNQNLEELMNRGKFRNDLYYRLRVFLIEIPPLRERTEDIPPLISYFLRKLSAKFGRDIKGISPKVLNAFLSYSWQGNIRQLRNALEEIAILSQSGILDELPSFIEQPDKIQLDGTMEQLEKQAIENALKKTGGNKTKAAKFLDIGLRTLYRKIEKYEIEI